MEKKEDLLQQINLTDTPIIFSIGYFLLLVLGLLHELIVYRYLGVNIIEYSSVSDFLLIPIVVLSQAFGALLMLALVVYIADFFFHKKIKAHEKNREEDWYIEKNDIAKLDEKYAPKKRLELILGLVLGGVIGLMLPATMSQGQKLKNEINSGSFELTHRLIYMDQEKIDVKIIGNNSQYLFFVQEGKNTISISSHPVIKRLERLDSHE